MTLLGKRAEIVSALTPLADVAAYTFRPAAPRPGDAWPLVGPIERGDGVSWLTTWRVFVFLPQDERAASEWIDAHFDALVDALSPVVFVDRVEPFLIPAAGREQFVLLITSRSE